MSWVLIHWLLINIILGFTFSIVFIANMSSDLSSSSTGFAWLAIIFFFPVVGLPLYLIFGGKKLEMISAQKFYVYRHEHVETRANPGAIEEILSHYKVPATTEDNAIELISSGEDAYVRLMNLLDQATETIEIQTYIIGNDEVGDAILERLAQKAQEGVIVRLLIDGLFAFVYPRGKLKKLRKAGVNVYLFLPLRFRLFRSRINLRNHRKLLIVDRQVAIMGGMNLAKNYMGPVKDENRWCDIAVCLQGGSVKQLAKLFCEDWGFASGQSIAADYHGVKKAANVSAIQVVASGPDVQGYPLYNTLLTLIFNAKKSLNIVTPYFVPDITLFRALSLAVFRGVKVSVVIPEHSNHKSADLARASYVRRLKEAGVVICFFEPRMIHAKVISIDGETAIIGSANFDMRSLFFNFESCLYLYSKPDIVAVDQWIDGLKKQSSCELVWPNPGRLRRMLENVVSLFSPLL